MWLYEAKQLRTPAHCQDKRRPILTDMLETRHYRVLIVEA